MAPTLGIENEAASSAARGDVDAREPCASGDLTVYRLHDVGYEIDLIRAAALLAENAPERPRPVRGEAHAIQIPNPPVTVRLGIEPMRVGERTQDVELSARLFDFGVVSLRARIVIDAPRPWSELARLGAEIGAGPAWPDCFGRWGERLLARIGPALQRPGDSGVVEDYTVFRFQGLSDAGGRPLPIATLSDEHVAALLFAEPRALTAAARKELLSPRFSYFEDDLAVLAWNAALIVEPADDEDVAYVLEFANAQLLELRYYDAVLDRELPHLNAEIADARRGFHLLGRRYARVLGALQARVADATEVTERVENALKVTDDVYLARVYATALEIFRGRTWRGGIERKVAIVREAYTMLNGEAVARRGEFLEITVIVLILVELILALLGRSR